MSGRVEPIKMNRQQMGRALAAIAGAHDEVAPGIARTQAETMANAAQALWSAVRQMDLAELDEWQRQDPLLDLRQRRILSALAAVRGAMQEDR